MVEVRLPTRASQAMVVHAAPKGNPHREETVHSRLEHENGLRPSPIAVNRMLGDEQSGTAER